MKTKRGFTLLELMIVVVILAIIASIAIPSYLSYIRKSRRNEVEAAIQQAVLMEERFRADCPTYGTKTTFGTQSSPIVCATDPIGPNPYAKNGTYYNLTMSAGTATAYSITATAVTGSGQDKDRAGATLCSPLKYDFGNTTAGVVTKTPAACW